MSSNGSGPFSRLQGWVPSHQPARQLDQTVGRFDTRPRTIHVRMRTMRVRLLDFDLQRHVFALHDVDGISTLKNSPGRAWSSAACTRSACFLNVGQ